MSGLEELQEERAALDVDAPGFELWRAAGLLTRVDGREPDLPALQGLLEHWSAGIAAERDALREAHGPIIEATLVAALRILFERDGLHGEWEEPGAPWCALLENVAKRRRGGQAALAVLVVDVLARVGAEASVFFVGADVLVGIPLRRSTDLDLVVIDPRAGEALSPQRVASRAGVPISELAEHLQPATPQAILLRLLEDLRAAYLKTFDTPALLRVNARQRLLAPRLSALWTQGGELHLLAAEPALAEDDARRALELAADIDDTAAARALLSRVVDARVEQ